MATTRHNLRMRKLEELSFVDRGGNQHSHIAIWKRATSSTVPGEPNMARTLAQSVRRLVKRLTGEAPDRDEIDAAIEEDVVLSKAADALDDIDELDDDDEGDRRVGKRQRGKAVIRKAAEQIAAATGEPIEKVLARLAKAAKKPARDTGNDPDEDDDIPGGEDDEGGEGDEGTQRGKKTKTRKRANDRSLSMETVRVQKFEKLEDANAHIAVVTRQLNDTIDRVAALEDAGDPIAEITKGMDAPAARAYRDMAKRQATMEKRARDGERVTKAATIFKAPVGEAKDHQQLAIVLKGIEGLPSAERQEAEAFVTEVFTKYAEQYQTLTQLLGEERGASGAVEEDADPIAKLDARVQEIMKADTKITKAVAVQKALEENPDLYDAYEDEEARAGRRGQ